MANGIVATAAEYLVKLGVSLDYSNMQKLEKFLDSSAFKAAQLGTALVAGSTAIYKFMKSMTSVEMEYVNLARKQQKSIENVRAEQNALKAMGKTAVEVAKDPALKKIQNDLVEIGKGMQLPDLTKPLESVRALQKEFYALKMTLQYALQWLNYYLLKDLKTTLDRLTAWFKKAREWVQVRIKPFTRRLATFLGDFVRGVEGILRIGEKILKIVDRLPSSIKSAGAIAVAVIATLNSGPLGKMLAILTAIGDIIKDYENFLSNKGVLQGLGLSESQIGNLHKLSNKYFDEAGKLNAAGAQYLRSIGLSQEQIAQVSNSVIGVGLAGLWGPLSNGDISGVFNEIGSYIGSIFNNLPDNVQKFLNGEIDLGTAIISSLNGVKAEDVEGQIDPFASTMAGIIGAAVGIHLGDKIASSLGFSDKDKAGLMLVGFSGELGNLIAEGFEKTPEGDYKSPIVNIVDGLLSAMGQEDLLETALEELGITKNGEYVNGELAEKLGGWASFLGKMIGMSLSKPAAWAEFGINLVEFFTQLGSVDFSSYAGMADALDALGQSIGAMLFGTGSPMLGGLFYAASTPTVREAIMDLLFGKLLNPEIDMQSKAAKNWLTGKRAGGGLWDKFIDIWLGEIDATTGKRPERGGVWGRILNWLLGDGTEDNMGALSAVGDFFAEIFKRIYGSLDEVTGGKLTEFISSLTGAFQWIVANSGSVVDAIAAIGGAITGYKIIRGASSLINIADKFGLIKRPTTAPTVQPSAPGTAPTVPATAPSTGVPASVPYGPEWLATEEGIIAAESAAGLTGTSSGGSVASGILHTGMGAGYGTMATGAGLGMAIMMGAAYLFGKATTSDMSMDSDANRYSDRDNVSDIEKAVDGILSASGHGDETSDMAKIAFLNLASAGDFNDFYSLFNYTNKNGDQENRLLKWLTGIDDSGKNNNMLSAAAFDWLNSFFGVDALRGISPELDAALTTGQASWGQVRSAGSTLDYTSLLTSATSFFENSGVRDSLGRWRIPVNIQVDEAQRDQELNKGTPTIDAAVSTDGSGKEGKAWGGRIGNEGVYTVGEDGPEYIIPITKPNRAMALIMQMFREMGGNALRKVIEGFGLNGGSDTIGGSLSSLGIPNASISIVNNVNVTNTILVQGGDRSASEIGLAAYDASERYLLRTLQGVLA